MASVSPFSSTAAAVNPYTSSSAASKQQQQQQAEVAQIAKLKATDQHVRAHEAAHLAAAGPYAASGANYTYEKGPDGQEYAVGGEVSIDDNPVAGNPQATIQKEKTVQAAAYAPTDPSPQDRAVAAQAASFEQTAEAELAQQSAQNGSVKQIYGPQQETNGSLLTVIL